MNFKALQVDRGAPNFAERFFLVHLGGGDWSKFKIVIPKESEFFEIYVPGQDDVIQPLAESDLYVQDFIGLKVLNESNRLIFLSTEGNHLKFTPEWFRTQIVDPFLS